MPPVCRLAAGFTIHLKHVLREFNKAPDALANKAMDAKESLGFNPIINLPGEDEISCPLPAKNMVNNVEVKPVVRKSSAKKQSVNQPGLFDDF